MAEHRVSQEAWEALRDFLADKKDLKLEGENSSRNDDGTFTIELDEAFEARLFMVMLPGETVEGFILRCLKKQLN